MNDDTDKILQSEMTDEETIIALARLCRHRGECMDKDAIAIREACDIIKTYREAVGLHKKVNANNDAIIKNQANQLKLERQLPILGRWMVAINNWAKS
jgi:hypothetical protein